MILLIKQSAVHLVFSPPLMLILSSVCRLFFIFYRL